ncbi:MAG TPA: outer membrane beta-barrel protein, partial [Thermoanaerobaculia bacterium]|nr:outer membrane beta-barrel protein [Thermoanaerobaculia bacterium]
MKRDSIRTLAPSTVSAPKSGPRGLVGGAIGHPLRRFVALSIAAFGCFAAGVALDAVLRPSREGRLAIAAMAFAGYLCLGRRALTALAPEIDRQWRRDPRRMRIAAFALLALVPTKVRAQDPSALPPSPPTPAPAVPASDSGKATFGGWVEAGYAANFDRPADRVNFGANFDWRANDYRLNQVYLSAQKPLDEGTRPSVGYRADFLAGHDAPFFVANGLFSNFTGLDPTSGVGTDGPASYRDVNAIGIDLPQFYLDLHFPHVLTDAGIDVRVGKFFTLMGREVYPAADTDFYSRAYENVYATPFTHTGFLVTFHATPTLDVIAGVVEGWDVFKDNNDAVSFHGAFIWNSADKRCNWTTTWI